MFTFIIFLVLLVSFPQRIFAIYDPLSVPNNKYGIHTVEAMDIPDIPALVNSAGGDWGYVTIVIGETDRNPDKWQRVFDQMRKLHLIPIIRLATHIEGSAWSKPKPDSFHEWVDFLNKLTWVIKNRYVILFNEPNHANEWGGTINPEEYAQRFVDLATQLKVASTDFFILPAGLDASAANDTEAMDEASFLRRMIVAKPEIGLLIDGWTSHSYPNPGFSGSPYAFGRGTLRTFDWEISFLQSIGITKPLPVFITETGWTHSEGKTTNFSLLTPERVADNIKIAASSVWTDPRIAAITPFVFNYQGLPFDHFSWKKLGGTDFYAHYDAYKSLPKQKGKPKKLELYDLMEPLFPPTMVTGSSYTFTAKLKNSGEAILDPVDGYTLSFPDTSIVSAEPLPVLPPGETGSVTVHVKTPEREGQITMEIKIQHDGETFPLTRQEVKLVPPPSLRVTAQLGWRVSSNASNVSILLYQKDNTLIHKFTGRTISDGRVTVDRITGIVPNDTYRVVVLIPNYLPRQAIVPLSDRETNVTLMRFLPLDFNGDGSLTIADLFALFKTQPNTVIPLFFGP